MSKAKKKVAPPLKWHGGKHYLAAKIVALMPKHTHYVEPYAGGLSVLLAKSPENVSEVVNDLNCDLAIFWRVLASESSFKEFQRIIEATPFSEDAWRRAEKPESETQHGKKLPYVTAVSNATAFFIRCRQSLAGRMKSFTGVTKTRTRRGMNNEVSAWLTAVEGLPAVHARLKRVLILNHPALDVIRGQDSPQTLFYLDPPYLHETRVTTSDYAHEMTEDQHGELLETLGATDFKGKFLLSGYRSELYDDWASACGWHRTDFDLANHAAGGKDKRRMVECIWSNFKPEAA